MGIETYEEWQLGQLDALIALGEYEKAYKTYEKAVRIYTEVSDLPVSEEMLKRSRKISQYLKGGYEDLDDIQVSFLEVAKKSEEQVYLLSSHRFHFQWRYIRHLEPPASVSIFLRR